jgi:hypothetical protein
VTGRSFGGVIRAWAVYPYAQGALGMKPEEDIELLESLFVELDPLVDGFAGVLVEVYRRGDRYILMEAAPVTGNLLIRFSSRDKELVYAALARELACFTR